MRLVDSNGNPPHSSATHYVSSVNNNRLWFAKVAEDGGYKLLSSKGGSAGSYSVKYLESIDYTIHPLKTLEELMEDYLNEKT